MKATRADNKDKYIITKKQLNVVAHSARAYEVISTLKAIRANSIEQIIKEKSHVIDCPISGFMRVQKGNGKYSEITVGGDSKILIFSNEDLEELGLMKNMVTPVCPKCGGALEPDSDYKDDLLCGKCESAFDANTMEEIPWNP